MLGTNYLCLGRVLRAWGDCEVVLSRIKYSFAFAWIFTVFVRLCTKDFCAKVTLGVLTCALL